ncbi:UNVERIFIED_CONTAM: hypothetical protein Sindi_1553200, partial [Sesamum indicum]
AEQYEKEVLYLHPSDNSSFVLASSSFNGSNYLMWSRVVYVALGCKMKLAFIDGTFPRPPASSALFEIEESRPFGHFVALEFDLEGHHGGFHGEISSISQGDMTLTSYLTKVKKLWNELLCLAPSSKCTCGGCTCGVNKAIGEVFSSVQLMQFLMGLHESFDKEKSQLLMMDPLPDLEKAFSMILWWNNSVQTQIVDTTNNAAYQ